MRRWLQAHGTGYVLAVTKAQQLGFSRVENRVAGLPPTAWQRLSAGDGAKGPRRYDWAYLPYGSDAAPGWEKGLLIRRSLAEPGKLAFYLTHAAHGTALADLVRCVFRGKAAGESKPSGPLIPTEGGHRFRAKPATSAVA